MRIKGKIDANQPAIVKGLRALGCSVVSVAGIGGGCGDLVIGRAGVNYFLEVKDEDQPPSKRRLTEDEDKFHKDWRGQIDVVENLDEAIAVVFG